MKKKIKQIWLRGEDLNLRIEETDKTKKFIKELKKEFLSLLETDNVYIVDSDVYEIDFKDETFMFELI